MKLLRLFCCAALSALCAATPGQAAFRTNPSRSSSARRRCGARSHRPPAPDRRSPRSGATNDRCREQGGSERQSGRGRSVARRSRRLHAADDAGRHVDGQPRLSEIHGDNLTPITQIGSVPFTVSVRPSLGVKTFPELLALIRSKPGQINCSTTANGSFPHLAAEMLKQDAKLDYQIIKHNGGAAAGTSVAGEHTISLSRRQRCSRRSSTPASLCRWLRPGRAFAGGTPICRRPRPACPDTA